MNENAKAIIATLTQYLESNPEIRFSQALFNLNINEFADSNDPSKKEFLLRDIYSDTDRRVLKRMTDSQ